MPTTTRKHVARGGSAPAGERATARLPSESRAVAAPAATPHGPIRSHALLLLLFAVAAGLKSLIFPPIGAWPISFLCFAPWILGCGLAVHPWRVYLYTFLLATGFYLLNMRWLYESAEIWYAALAVYMALFEVLAACPLRHVLRRRKLPLAIAFPVIWTGMEFLRSIFLSGFPWFMLAHSQYRVLPLIQIADLVGAFGVTFVTASVNGALADALLWAWQRRDGAEHPLLRRHTKISAVAASLLLTLSLTYGAIQLGRNTMSPGPKIAVVQGDYLNTVRGDEASPIDKFKRYRQLLTEASAQQADLYLLPESTWGAILNPEFRLADSPDPQYAWGQRFSQQTFEFLSEFSRSTGAPVVAGATTLIATPYDLRATERMYNSAFVFTPDGAEPGRYDKRHLVVFGEIVPFRFGRLRPLYFWINARVPFSGPENREFSSFPGETFRTFSMKAASLGGREFRFGIPICYEDVMPYISREFAAGPEGKRVDFLLNISNDGWFGHGSQQEQHLSQCVFRAVENRVGIARAVNTGVSGFIEPTGRMHDMLSASAPPSGRDRSGFSVATLMTDSRFSRYSRDGDWFGWTCLIGGILAYLDYTVARARGQGYSPPG